jgi:AraC-like DNA-binding protein
MLESQVYYDLCERAVRSSHLREGFSLKVGSMMKSNDYGAFGLAWKSAINLRKSFERAERYWRVLTSVSVYELVFEKGRYWMTLHRDGNRNLGLRISNEQTISAIYTICNEVSSVDFKPKTVCFKHQRPENISAHEEFFGCPVYFNADRDAIEVSEDTLEAPNLLADDAISLFFDSHLRNEVSTFKNEQNIGILTKDQIAQSLSEGVPSLAEIASRLNMSPRTLQRRLSEASLNFKALIVDCQLGLAKRLLRGTEYSLTDIAFLTGFSDQSAFSRGFKRWSGTTPRSYRLEAISLR